MIIASASVFLLTFPNLCSIYFFAFRPITKTMFIDRYKSQKH